MWQLWKGGGPPSQGWSKGACGSWAVKKELPALASSISGSPTPPWSCYFPQSPCLIAPCPPSSPQPPPKAEVRDPPAVMYRWGRSCSQAGRVRCAASSPELCMLLRNHYPLRDESIGFLAHSGSCFPCSVLGSKHHL